MSRIKIWNKVPDKSQLHVHVEGTKGTVSGVYTVSDGLTEQWTDAMLHNPTGQNRTLRKPKTYNLSLMLKFAASTTLRVKAHVLRPDNTHHGKDYDEPVSGQAGEVKSVVIGVVTLQS